MDFEGRRPRLRAVAYRMLGSLGEADDALQEAWLRADRAGTDGVDNVDAWLTTIVVRVCLNMMRARRDETRLPDPVISTGPDPEQEAMLADAVGLALQVVLDELNPPERVAFVLHDMFAVPYDEIAPMLERTPDAARQLASRARRRVREVPAPEPDPVKQRAVVDAFFAASRAGDVDALIAVLDEDVVLRSDAGARDGRTQVLRGARTVASQAALARRLAPYVRPALVNGTAGAVVVANGRPIAVMAFTVTADKITSMEILLDLDRLAVLVG